MSKKENKETMNEQEEVQQEETVEKKEVKTDKRAKNFVNIFIIISLIIIIILLLLRSCGPAQQQQTAVFAEKPVVTENSADQSGMVRMSFNPFIHVKYKTIQDLSLENKNEDRYMKLVIQSEDGKVVYYQSPMLAPGEKVLGDIIDIDQLKQEVTPAIGAVHFFDMEKNATNVTNVNMTITKDADQSTPNG